VPARVFTHTLTALELRGTPEPWHCKIVTDLTERAAGSLRPGSAEYLVFSDNLLIAVLTVAAQVELPDYPLSPVQRRHQRAAGEALADLPRNTLRDLADRRASMDGRDDQIRLESHPPVDAIRVAAVDDPTVTDWVTIDADLETSRTSIRCAGLDPDRLIVITAPGYGRYGRDRHRLDLPVLSAMHQLAARHDVTVAVVGDWLDAEGATNAYPGPSPEQIRSAFTAAYIGVFASELDYTRHHMTELGWISALEHAGIPDRYLDAAAVNRDWFRSRFRGISRATHQRVDVFHRTTPAG
jgi:hypothetical protein